MDKRSCGECKFFIQHYILNKRGLSHVFFGHCTLSKAKEKRPYAKCCENFIEGSPDTERFVSKEYLTKELLRRVLDMELMPEIYSPEKPN